MMVHRLPNMRRHVLEHAPDVLVGRGVEHVPPLPRGAQHAGRAEKPEVMADQDGDSSSERAISPTETGASRQA